MDTTKLTFYLEKNLRERAYDVVFWRSGPPDFLTMSSLCARGVELAVEEAEKKYNHGKRFRKRTGKIKSGRPIAY